MRQARRLSFAAPFVVVVTACGSSKPPEELHRNPPPPSTSGLTSEQCKALTAEASCEPDDITCNIDGDGCGLVGYKCRGGRWVPMVVACNPPSPSD